MKRQMMVRIKNTPVENYGCRLNPESSSGIYMTAVKEAQCHIVAKNRRKQDEVKENLKWSNSVKRATRIIKQVISYDNILSAVAKLLSATNTTEDSAGSILHAIIPLSSDNLNKDFIYMDRKISYFPNLKKRTVALENERRWVKDVIKEVARKIAYLRGRPRMEQGWQYIVLSCLF